MVRVTGAPERKNMSGKQLRTWEKEWFAVKNPICLKCEKKCKQSVHVEIIACPGHKKMAKLERH